MGGGGAGFFSIPVGTIAKVPVTMVCLEHGKKSPRQSMNYTIVPPEKFSSDPRVHEICKAVGTGQLDRASAQAAAWHISSKMSWSELANKMYNNLGTSDTPYFTHEQLVRAQSIVSMTDARVASAKERAEQSGTAKVEGPTAESTAR